MKRTFTAFRFVMAALIKVVLLLPVVFLAMHTLVRVIRHFYKFPIPHFLANAIDHPLRRRFITPPDQTALRHGIRKGMTVLEVGPGNGRYTAAAARRVGDNGKIYAVDIEPAMILRVQRRAAREGIANIDARVADVYALPFPDGIFDVIYMTAVIGEIPEPEKALAEFHRVLKQNGILVFSELFMDPDYPLPDRLIRLAALANFRLKRRLGDFFYYTLHFEKSQKTVIPPMSRVVRSQDTAKKTYERLSVIYDLVAAPEWPLVKAALDRLAIAEGENVLDIGAGTGRTVEYLAHQVGPAGRVYGIDLSEGMLAQAGKRLGGLLDQVDLQVADALSPPYPDGSMDTVFMSFTLELFDTPEIPQVLAACRRVLREDGRIGVVSLAKQDVLPVHLYELAHRAFPALADCRPIYATRLLESAGFALVEHHQEKLWGLPVDFVIAVNPTDGKEMP